MLGNRGPSVVTDIGQLAARLLLGAVLVAHGWQKLKTNGLDGTSAGFDAMGVPAPEASAIFAALVELGGGALLIAGLLTPLAALLVALDMAGAYWFAHRGAGPFVDQGGWELVAVIAAGALALGAMGPGRLSVDDLIARRGRRAAAA